MAAMAQVLKRDSLGTVRRDDARSPPVVVRDTSTAAAWLRPLARRLARREAAALRAAAPVDGIPQLIAFDGTSVERSFIEGVPMYEARPRTRRYFKLALRLLRRMHRCGIAHNDLAKEANWLSTPQGEPAVIDFQIAYTTGRRSKWFRLLAREDLRHLLKHKRYYLPEALTARQRGLLARPILATRLWRSLFKPAYRWFTRRILRWPDRSGPEERQIDAR